MSASTYLFLVDDDEDDRELFRDAVHEISMETKVDTFKNGISLMEHLEDATNDLPQAIYLDINMPLMSGEECIVKIRRNKRFDAIPIVIYSTSFVLQTAERMKKIGANLYIQKPSSYSQLKAVLNRSMSKLFDENAKINEDFDFIIRE